MLAIPLKCTCKHLPLVVELLTKEVVQLEVCESPEAHYCIHTHLRSHWFVETLIPIHLLGSVQDQDVQLGAVNCSLHDDVVCGLVELYLADSSIVEDHVLKTSHSVLVPWLLQRLPNHQVWIDSLLLDLVCFVVIDDVLFQTCSVREVFLANRT